MKLSHDKSFKSNKSSGILEDFKKCLKLAPMPVISLIIYMSLRSSDMLPNIEKLSNLWHPIYLGWYDFLLGASIVISIINGIIKLDKEDVLFILSLLSIISLSFLSGIELGNQYILDTIVFLLRFLLSFYLAKGLVFRLGIQATENLLIIVFIILAISALFVYQLQFGTINRIYAAAMTIASFSQVCVIVCLIALLRQYNKMVLFSLMFLLLTFSRTSILFLILLFMIYSRELSLTTTIKYYILIIGFATFTIFMLLNFGGDIFSSLIADRTDSEEISTLNSRDAIWVNGLQQIASDSIPLFGVGWNATPSLIIKTNLSFIHDDTVYYPPHYHSILLEYALGLGISSLFIWFFLFKRIWQTFYHHCYPAFFIFAFFLMSQSGDFTFYRPKELIIWSFMLGLAEGQWRLEHG
jgi:hypothetical protein